ncbi:hypothetical protein [Arthrobacter globiformis]|uniref:DUF3224 domain-containing protein n=1 Tax=Arthrobacter globiformis TaxID=1665 RepID=A0A328HMB4_ARTGO|nr:hypothetical protein [Arthrobacter globiformis]RAM38370.1 hypothetical protein DBZ45_05040 [Arthrobacter globiformis]
MTDHQVGTLCGAQVDVTVTYVGTIRPSGTVAGNDDGFVATAGRQTATLTGHGVTSFGSGQLTGRGALFCETTSDELSRLNGIAVLFEYQVADGKSEGRLFEWK